MMGPSARLHAHHAGRERGEKLQHLPPPEPLAQDHPLGFVHTVDLEHVLCQGQTDAPNLRPDFPPLARLVDLDLQSATSDAVEGGEESMPFT